MSRVLVTGCSSGIGRATAALLQRAGHSVAATGRRRADLDGLAVDDQVELDVTSGESVASCAGLLDEIEILINNAGVTLSPAPIESIPCDAMTRILDTNVMGPLRVIRGCLPGMRKRRNGRIINVSSVSAHCANPLLGAYSASKAALDSLSEALRLEVAHLGIVVCCVEPSGVRSSFSEKRLVAEAAPADYAPVQAAMSELFAGFESTRIPADQVAAFIRELIDHPSPPLRNPVGLIAHRLLAGRQGLDDAQYERSFSSRIDRRVPQ
jgi:NAD(P)-dependent dehydrogenase (short-subunit alcohol dehydrogenase family)